MTVHWSGGTGLSLRDAGGAEVAIVHPVEDEQWHYGRWRRTETELGLFVDDQPAAQAARNGPPRGPVYFGVELDPGRSVRLRHFAATAAAPAADAGAGER